MAKSIKVITEFIPRDRRIELTNYFLDKPMEGILKKSKNRGYAIRYTQPSGSVKYYEVDETVTDDMVERNVVFSLEGEVYSLVAVNVKVKDGR